MSLTTIYSLLPPDPTTELWLCWITESNEGSLTLDYGTDPGSLSQSVSATSASIPSGTGERLYQARLSALTPGETYYYGVSGLFGPGDVLPARTFPAALATALKFVTLSDIHIELRPGTFQEPEDMDPVGAEMPDMLVMPGDLVRSNITAFSAPNLVWWRRFMEEYLPRASVSRLVPVILFGGNHEYGNNSWDGETFQNSDFDGTPAHFFFPNTVQIEPVGERYGTVKIGDYFQLVGLDTHATRPLEVGAWLRDGVIDPEMLFCLPVSHSPFFGAANRSAGDPDLQQRHRDGSLRALIEAPNVYFTICGHVHRFSRSLPLGIAETDPGAVEKVALSDLSGNPDGWIVSQPGGLIEIGQGYLSDRSPSATPMIAFETGGQASFNVITLDSDKVRVETKDASGGFLWAQSWPFTDVPSGAVTVQSGGDWVSGALRVQSGGDWA